MLKCQQLSRNNTILFLSEPENNWFFLYFYTYEHLEFHAQESWAWKKFYNLGAKFTYVSLENESFFERSRSHDQDEHHVQLNNSSPEPNDQWPWNCLQIVT